MSPRKSSGTSVQRVNWADWRDAHMMPLRDAVALSLNFEPSTVTAEHREFAGRLKLAVAHYRSRRILRLNMQTRARSNHPALCPVWLPHFAAWAKGEPNWTLPATLADIAQVHLSSAAEPASPEQRRAITVAEWQRTVRALADELCLRNQRAGIYATKKTIAGRVAIEAAKQGLRGPRGELTPRNILRAALQGDKWQRPRLKKAARKP